MPHARAEFGATGEQLAAAYLVARGFQLREQNVRTPYGELDLVAEHRGALVFVEVKARRTQESGYPEESVTRAKRAHLRSAVAWYLAQRPALRSTRYQIDVVAIRYRAGRDPEIVHIPNAVGERER